MGMRRIRSLIGGLPHGCALQRALDPEGWEWRPLVELMASLVEVTFEGNRLFLSANSKKGAPIPPPLHIPRPNENEGTQRKQASSEEIGQLMEGRIRVVDE